jgi:hypothetical protein
MDKDKLTKKELMEIRAIYQVQVDNKRPTIQLNRPYFRKLLEAAETWLAEHPDDGGKPRLHAGCIYKCSDGEVRRLDKIEPSYLHYSIAINITKHKIEWMKLSKTYRSQVEQAFLQGQITTEQEVMDEFLR